MLFKPHRIPKAVLVGDVQADAMPPHKRKIIPCRRRAQKVLQHCLVSQRKHVVKNQGAKHEFSEFWEQPKKTKDAMVF